MQKKKRFRRKNANNCDTESNHPSSLTIALQDLADPGQEVCLNLLDPIHWLKYSCFCAINRQIVIGVRNSIQRASLSVAYYEHHFVQCTQ